MNKFFQSTCTIAVALILTSCADFRINMKRGFSAHTPAKPAPALLAGQWLDVGEWQDFLASKHFLKGKYENTFDRATEEATKKFQRWAGPASSQQPLPVLPATGCVNFATYHKAIREGLPKTKTVMAAACVESTRMMMTGGATPRIIGNNEKFYTPMKFGCTDKTGDPEVTDWQLCLMCLGYMTGHDGIYRSNTQAATAQFQSDSQMVGIQSGTVDALTTFRVASGLCPMRVTIKDGAPGCSN